MKKIDYQGLIKESEEELKRLLEKEKHHKLKERCEVLYWLKSGRVSTMTEAMKLKNRSNVHGINLWKLYREKGLSEYLKLNYKGRKSPLIGRKELEERLRTKGFSTINEARLWILEVYQLEYTENGLGNYFRNKKIKLKTGRPHHPKHDEEKRKVYKKNTKKN